MSETKVDPFSGSESEFEPTNSDESSDIDVAGRSSRKKHPKKKHISLEEQPTESVGNNEPTIPVTKN